MEKNTKENSYSVYRNTNIPSAVFCHPITYLNHKTQLIFLNQYEFVKKEYLYLYKIANFQTFQPTSRHCPTMRGRGRGLRDLNYYKRECMATYTRSMFGAIFGTIFRCIGVCDAIQCLLFVYNDFNSSRPASYT